MDALSDVFAAVRLSGGVFLDAEFSGPWCVESQVGPEEFAQDEMPAHLIAYHYVVAGRMFVQVGGTAVEVAAGEMVLLPRNAGHLLASAPGLQPPPLDPHLQAPDAEALMRSRYSAYVGDDLAYLRATWAPETCPPDLEAAPPGLRWLGLEVRHHEAQGADHATVEFVARSKLGGRAQRLHEHSRFERRAGCWLYVDGDILP